MSDEYARMDGEGIGDREPENYDWLRTATHSGPIDQAQESAAPPSWRVTDGEPVAPIPPSTPQAPPRVDGGTQHVYPSAAGGYANPEQQGTQSMPPQGGNPRAVHELPQQFVSAEPPQGANMGSQGPRMVPPAGGGGSSGRHGGPPNGHNGSRSGGHWKRWLIIILAVVVLLGAGVFAVWRSGVIDFLTATPSPTPLAPPPVSQSATQEPPAQEDSPTWPLTGVASLEIAERPSLAIKVENSADARPQQGLEVADIVYEELVEGGIPRYVAIFHSTLPDQVVPIRSIRPMDGPIASWTKGLMVFSGGQTAFSDRAKKDGMQLISMDYGADGFSRVKGRIAPHNVAGNIQEILAQADGSHQASPPPFAAFASKGQLSTAQSVGGFANHVDATLGAASHPQWAWDVASQSWLRSEGDKPAMAAAGTQLSSKNVLLLSVQVRATGGVDVHGTGIPETVVVGSGDGVVLSSQMAAPITWQKNSETEPMQFFDAGGNPLVLLPGNTWIELVPTTGSYTVS